MVLRVHTTLASANGRKPLAYLRHVGIDHEFVDVNVYRGEGQAPGFLRLNRPVSELSSVRSKSTD